MFIPTLIALAPKEVDTLTEYIVYGGVVLGALAGWWRFVRPPLREFKNFIRSGQEFFVTVNSPMEIAVSPTETKEMRLREAFGHLARGQVEMLAGLAKSEAWRTAHDHKWPMDEGEVHQ